MTGEVWLLLLIPIFLGPTIAKWTLFGYWNYKDKHSKTIPDGSEFLIGVQKVGSVE